MMGGTQSVGEITTTVTASSSFDIQYSTDLVPGTYDFKVVLTLTDLSHEIQSQYFQLVVTQAETSIVDTSCTLQYSTLTSVETFSGIETSVDTAKYIVDAAQFSRTTTIANTLATSCTSVETKQPSDDLTDYFASQI
jgi:hypothetical protein